MPMGHKVRIYSTPSCHYCQQAKEFLTEKGIEFDTIDVSTDKEAFSEMRKISGGARSVPVIAVGDRVIVGFEQDKVEEALKSL